MLFLVKYGVKRATLQVYFCCIDIRGMKSVDLVPLILMMSAFFCKKIAFFVQKSTFLRKAIVWELHYRFFCSVFARQKVTVTENITFANSLSGIRPPNCSKLARIPKNDNDVTIFRHDVNVTFFDVVLFLLSSLVTGRSFMSISALILELWQFSFIRDWPETWKSEIPPSEFCPISGDWGELWVPNLARMSLIECHWMLQNSRVTTLTVLELLGENQLGG